MSWTLIPKLTNTAQDGVLTEPPQDGGYSETAPSEFGVPDGFWTDSGDGWTPSFTPVMTSWNYILKPTGTWTSIPNPS